MFKYYISEVEGGGGSRPLLISLMQGGGGGVQNLEKCADVILERSLNSFRPLKVLNFGIFQVKNILEILSIYIVR